MTLFGYTVDFDFIEDTLYCNIPEVHEEKTNTAHYNAKGGLL